MIIILSLSFAIRIKLVLVGPLIVLEIDALIKLIIDGNFTSTRQSIQVFLSLAIEIY